MKCGKFLLGIMLVLSFAAVSYAAPVGLTSEADAVRSELWPNEDFGLTLGFVADIIDKRKIDIDSGEFEMEAFMARIGVTALNKFNFYIDLGQATDPEFNYVIQGEQHKTEFRDKFIWGVGASGLIYRWDNGLEIGLNLSYRRADLELEKTTIDGTTYQRNQMTQLKDGNFEEYQGALELAWKTDVFTPYIGVKLSEAEVDASFTVNGAQHDADGRKASQNIGAFVGLAITPKLSGLPLSEQLEINLESRFIDEEAFNVGISYRF